MDHGYGNDAPDLVRLAPGPPVEHRALVAFGMAPPAKDGQEFES